MFGGFLCGRGRLRPLITQVLMRIGSYVVEGYALAVRQEIYVNERCLTTCGILCLQETFLPKPYLGKWNSFKDNFHRAGDSTMDLSMDIVWGRIAGVAILWHKKLDAAVTPIRLGVDWCIAVQIKVNGQELYILNVYMPYEFHENEDKYLGRLAFLNMVVSENRFIATYIVGNMNADLSGKRSSFCWSSNGVL